MKKLQLDTRGIPILQGRMMREIYGYIHKEGHISSLELQNKLNEKRTVHITPHAFSGYVRRLVQVGVIEKHVRQPVRYGVVLSLPEKYKPLRRYKKRVKRYVKKDAPLPDVVDANYFIKNPPFTL